MKDQELILWTQLKTVLSSQLKHIERLCLLENEKYDILQQVNLEELLKLNTVEEEKILEIQGLENRRKVLINHLKEETASLIEDRVYKFSELVEALNISEKEKEEMKNLNMRINKETEKLRLYNRRNETVLRANLEIIEMTLSYTETKGEPESDYGQKDTKEQKTFLFNEIA